MGYSGEYPWDNYSLPKDICRTLNEIKGLHEDDWELEQLVDGLEEKIKIRMWLVSNDLEEKKDYD